MGSWEKEWILLSHWRSKCKFSETEPNLGSQFMFTALPFLYLVLKTQTEKMLALRGFSVTSLPCLHIQMSRLMLTEGQGHHKVSGRCFLHPHGITSPTSGD